MLGIFRRKKICSNCGISNETSKIIGFDPTNRDEFQEIEVGKKETLCTNCLKKRWEEALKKYQGIAVCFLPVKELNSYSYTTLDRAKEWSISEEEISLLEQIINKYSQEKCQNCSATRGNFLFFSFPYYNPQTEEIILKNNPQEIPQPLCGHCFAQRIVQEIEMQNLSIDEINTPFGEKGIYMAGEY